MENKNRFYLIQSLFIFVALALGVLVGTLIIPNNNITQIVAPAHNYNGNKVDAIIDYAEQNYVDSVDREKMISDAINGMLQHLDPHSSYISREEFLEMSEEMMGNFHGIGIQFNIFSDTITVVNTISGGPSEKLGIMAGDRIVIVDGENVAGVEISDRDVIKKLKGPKETKVKVEIKRSGVSQLIPFEIVRDVIPLYSVDVAFMANPQTAYVKISQFSATTAREFEAAVSKMKNRGAKNLIIDLRGNSGGFLDAAVHICEMIMPKERMIVYTEGRMKNREEYKTYRNGKFSNMKLAVLMDDWSASASEILAGAVQDNDLGFVIGRRSFGKGLVQEQIELRDGSAVRITVARYYTPSGRCIQRQYSGSVEDYYSELIKRFDSGEMENVDSLKIQDTVTYYTLSGREVYGGGGIIPDYFIPLEKNIDKAYFNVMFNMGLINRFSFQYVDENRRKLKAKYDAQSFIDNYVVSDKLLEKLFDYSHENGHKRVGNVSQELKDEFKLTLKSFIGRNLYGEEAFYPIYLQSDKVFLKAIDIFKQ